jgi:hypothetical protein
MQQQIIFDTIVNGFMRNLHGVKTILNKAQEHAKHHKFDVNTFLDMKLAPDMFNFTRQIQMASDNAKGAAARLSGSEAPKFEDNEKSWEELIARVDKTINYLAQFKSDDFKNYADQKISFPWYPGMHLTGHDYLTSFALPNFYFHVTTAYSILRGNGVQIGKGNFLGEINWKKN